MGTSAEANVWFGFGFTSEEVPPAWSNGDEDHPRLVLSDALRQELTTYLKAWDSADSDNPKQWLKALVEARGFDDLLTVALHGSLDYGSAPFIRVQDWGQSYIEVGELHMLDALENAPIHGRALGALVELAEELGVPAQLIGWYVTVYYG